MWNLVCETSLLSMRCGKCSTNESMAARAYLVSGWALPTSRLRSLTAPRSRLIKTYPGSPVRFYHDSCDSMVNPAAQVSDGMDHHKSRSMGPTAAAGPPVDTPRSSSLPPAIDAAPLKLLVKRQRCDTSPNRTPACVAV